MKTSTIRMMILGAVLLSPAAFTTRVASGESPADKEPAPGFMAKITLLNGSTQTMKFDGVGCTSSMCSRTVLKSKTGDSAVSTRLDSIAAIKNVSDGDALFILRDGTERRMSLLTDFRVLYLINSRGASEKLDLAKIKDVEFLATQVPPASEDQVKAILLKHLAISRDFTLKVAEQMPAGDYDFKLTPAQMSFAEQMVHLAQTFDEFVSPVSGQKLDLGKPVSMSKPDVIEFVKKSFDAAMERVTAVAPEQFSKTFTSYGTTGTGLEFMLELLDHTTQHRASAEMYLRAKGITPAAYQF